MLHYEAFKHSTSVYGLDLFTSLSLHSHCAAYAVLRRFARRLPKLPKSFLRGGPSLAMPASPFGFGGGSEKTGLLLDGGIYVGSGRG